MHHINRQHIASPVTAFAGITTLFFILALALAACGSNGGTGGSPAATPAAAQKCGTIHTYPNGKLTDPASAKTAEDCFWQAYQKCQPATLIYDAGGVDTVATNTFTISSNSGGKCAITDKSQLSIVPATPAAPRAYSCTGMTQQQDGLHINACGDRGDIIIPASAGA